MISGIGSYFATYITEEAGLYQTRQCTPEEFAEWKSAGVIRWWGDIDSAHPDAKPYEVFPIALWLSRIEDNYDFLSENSW